MKSNPKFSQTQLIALRQAGELAAAVACKLPEIVVPGKTEKEIAWQINKMLKSGGADSLAFRTIVAAGSGSSQPHHKNTNRKIRKNEIVLVDFGPKCQGMTADISRTLFLGRPKPEWERVYKIVSSAYQKSLNYLRNISFRDQPDYLFEARFLDRQARAYIEKKGFGKNFPHGLGHGLGSRVHQYFHLAPKSSAKLGVGSVFTIEPGIYLKGRFGVRIEDTILLSDSGPVILTALPPHL